MWASVPYNRTMARKPKTLSEQLRAAILDADISRYRMSKETGIDQSALSRFVSGERMLSMKAADKIGRLLELEIVQRKAK